MKNQKYNRAAIIIILFCVLSFGAAEKGFAEWIEALPAESIRNDTPLQGLQLKLEDAHIVLKLAYKEDLKLPGEVLGKGNETGILDSISVLFDLDNDPDNPKFFKGFEREVLVMQAAKVRCENAECLRLVAYSFEIKEYSEGKLGEVLFDSSSKEYRDRGYVVVDKNFVTVRIPKEYINLDDSEVRIGVKYKFNKIPTNHIKI